MREEIVRSLDDWERALLRDFVRGKGHGSVSRIPVELFNEQSTDLEDAEENNFVAAFIDRRKPLLQKVDISIASTLPSTSPSSPPPHSLLPSTPSRIVTRDENVDETSLKTKLIEIRIQGSANQTNDGYYNFVASITLVEDNGKNILVDTGLGTDINGRMELLKALQKQNIAPPNIDIVVTTHGHPDHAGGVHDFPDAIHYQGWYIHHHTIFNLSSLFESNQHSLTDNVYLMKSTGHSSDDIAVAIIDEQNMGRVIISGDTFMRREDLDYPMMWQPLSANETEQAISRRTMICQANWIVPGHGAPFQVTKEMRTQFFC
ncbi:unnamed protein product [Angiostrongylus costaricensis]|uniref:Metallo-beta-lactamase domain-containing protein 1 n=1 Tax=Angiostrongylus costaricensis TaxID=334426 RepID=A0A0R3P9F7_ANGCS|nr:unnamed protein product [Angiostrongylus costaricensis]